jgi:hypothetical protein
VSEIVDHARRRLLGTAAAATAVAQLGMFDSAMQRLAASASGLPVEREMPSLGGAAAWLNSPPLSAGGLRGKVVRIDFCTYTCINWLRTLPYVRAWGEKYKQRGLVVIGVHTPEFSFEHDIDNVRRAVKRLMIAHPIAIDNAYAIWNAFRNQYWPALYFVDAEGQVRHHHFGEGDYERSERMIQRLLAKAGADRVDRDLVSVTGRGIEAAADWDSLKSPETYLGHERTRNFTSPGGAAWNQRRVYAWPNRLRLNQWALAGDWTFGREAVLLNSAAGRVAFRFRARDLHLVMGPARSATAVRFRVRIDGNMPGAARGLDIDAQGIGVITERRLYQLLRQPRPIAERQFEIEFLDAGVEALAFTFG